MKKTVSIVLALILLFTSTPICVFADTTEAYAPYMLSVKCSGKTLCKTEAFLSKQKGLNLSATKASGIKTTINKGTQVSVIGKNRKTDNWLYVTHKISGVTYYGYVDSKNICIQTSKNSKIKSVKRYNAVYKKKVKYRYININGMHFYEFDQSKNSSKVINGLKIGYSCGPQTVAAALSALNGDVIFPEVIMKKMSRASLAPDLRGAGTNKVIGSVKPYIKSKYKLNYEFEIINRDKIFEYLKNGYMVITAVEDHDGLSLFTKNAHYILLIGYDSVGNVIAFSSNKRVGFCDSYSESRISANFPNANIDEDIIAIKWKYDDSYEKLAKAKSVKLTNNAKAYQHYYGYGKIYKLKKKQKVTILGKRGKTYYIKFKESKKIKYGFINQKYIILDN